METDYPKVFYSLFKENKKFVVKIYNPRSYKGHSKQIKRSTGETEGRAAKRKALQIIDSFFSEDGQAAIHAKTGKIETVSAMLDKYYEKSFLQNIKKHPIEKQRIMMASTLSRIKHLNRHLGKLNPKTLDMNLIDDYIIKRRADLKPNGQHYSDGTIVVEINLLKTSVKVLISSRFTIKQNMKGHIKIEQVPRENSLEDDEYENMLEKFNEYDRENDFRTNFGFYFEMLRFTGVRSGQMKLLEFSEIKEDKHRLEFPPEKTKHEKKKKHLVYLDNVLLLKLIKLFNNRDIDKDHCRCSKVKTCKITKADYVFRNQHKPCKPFSKDVFYKLWDRFCDELNYTKIDMFKKSEKTNLIKPHDLRRTYIISMIEEGWDRKFIMKQTGHTGHDIFNDYNEISDDAMIRFVESQREAQEKVKQRKVDNINKLDKDYKDLQESLWDARE